MNDAEVLGGGTNLKTSIDTDFEEFCGDVLGMLLYGSRAPGRWSERSDMDSCIVAKLAGV